MRFYYDFGTLWDTSLYLLYLDYLHFGTEPVWN